MKSLLLLQKFGSNCIIFFIFSVLITYICEKLSPKMYNYKFWWFSEKKWERGGAFYQKNFNVRSWKKVAPELGQFVSSIFSKKHLNSFENNYLETYLRESCRAEFAHCSIILSSLLFFMWSTFGLALLMVIGACILNLPFVIIQRYNRPRIVKFLKRKYKYEAAKGTIETKLNYHINM